MPDPPWSQTRPQHTSLSFLFSFFLCISERRMPIVCQGSTFKESAVLKETLAANILSQLWLLPKSETKLYGKKHFQRINCTEGSICNESPVCLVQSTFVPNNCLLCLCCVLHIIRVHLQCSPKRRLRWAVNSVQISWNSARFLPSL